MRSAKSIQEYENFPTHIATFIASREFMINESFEKW